MRTWQWINFAPDRTDFSSLTTVKTLAFVQDATTHSFLFYIVVVLVDKCFLFFQFFFCELSLEFFAYSFERFATFVLVAVTRCCDGISLVVTCSVNSLTEFFVVFFVAIFALHGRTNFFHQFHLSLAVNLDSFVSSLQSFEQILFAHFVHFAFHHHDVFVSSSNHQVHICLFELFESWVDNELAIDASYANF